MRISDNAGGYLFARSFSAAGRGGVDNDDDDDDVLLRTARRQCSR